MLSHLIATQHKQYGTCLKIGAREAWNFIPCRSNRKATTQEKQEEQPPNCKYVHVVGKYVAFRVTVLKLLGFGHLTWVDFLRDIKVLADDTAFYTQLSYACGYVWV